MLTNNGFAWYADHFRVTIFLNEIYPLPADALSAVFGVTVGERSENKAAGSISESAMRNNERFEILQSFNRIDFTLHPVGFEPSVIPLLSIEERINTFIDSINKWVFLQNFNVNRLALGIGGMLETQSNLKSYERLSELLRVVKIDPSRFKELIFQVNLPTVSKSLSNLKINRVSNWAALIFKPQLSVTPQINFPERYFCRCITDFSTDETGSALLSENKEATKQLLDELTSSSIELLNTGIE